MPSLADTLTWDGAGDGGWTDGRWTGTPPTYPDANTHAVVRTNTVAVTGAQHAHRVTVESGGVSIGPGASLTLDSAAAIRVDAGASLTLNGGSLIAANGIGTISSLVLNSQGTIDNAGQLSVGTLSDGGTAGTLTKQGAGDLLLAGTSPSTLVAGTGFGVQAGRLVAVYNAGNNPLGDASVALNGGGLVLSGTAAGAFDNAVTVAQSGTITAQSVPPGVAGQTVTLGSASRGIAVASGQTLTLATAANYTLAVSGAITGPGSLTVAGYSGAVRLDAANSFEGQTTIAGGTLRLGHAEALPAGRTLAMSGTGTLDLNGYGLTVSNITSSSSTNTITDSGSGSGTSTLTISSGTPATVAAVIRDGNTRKVAVNLLNSNSGTTPFALNSPNTFSGGVTLLHGTGSGTRLRVTGQITTVGSPGAIVSSPFGTGPITIGQAATDKAAILFDSVNNNTLVNDVIFNTTAGTDVVGGIRIDTTGHTFSGILTANLAAATFNTGVDRTGSVALTGRVTGSRGLGVYGNNGTLTVTLNNQTPSANNYQGDTVVGINMSPGRFTTLRLGAPNQIPHGAGAGNVIVNSNGTGVGMLDLNTFSETINGLSGNGVVDTVAGGAPTLTVGGNNASSTFAGTIQNTAGSLSLEKTGAGMLTLSGTNTYSGTTTIHQGTLQVGAGGTGGTLGTGTVINHGSLVFNRADNVTVGNDVAGSGSLHKIGGGTLALTGANTHTGITAVHEGALLVNGSLAGGSGVAVGTGVIYTDGFGGSPGDNLQGTHPDFGSRAWTASGHWKADGSRLSTGDGNAFLPFTPESGRLYSVSIDLNPNSPIGATDWFAVGFTNSLSTTGNFHLNGAAPWMLLRVDRTNNMQTFLGPSTAGGVTHNGPWPEGFVNMTIELDTRPSQWTAQWFLDGAPIRTTVFSTNPGINYVSFGGYNTAVGQVDNFRLSVLEGAPAAVLGGSGFIGADTTIGKFGILSPGESIGTLTFTEGASLTLDPGATIDWEFVNNAEAGETYDYIVGQDLFLPDADHAIMLNIAGRDGYTISAGDSFSLFSGNVHAGSTPLAYGDDITNLFHITDNINWWGTWQVTAGGLTLTAVPEPGACLLLLSALTYALLMRRRKPYSR
ncbi:MAG: autotransporter-associated beta strand repeat-containing protein [Thermoguttaceae bacterium]|nr:autotransporter-associated beta strand repeat-containing protein [Thermoguttaceae bacterium]